MQHRYLDCNATCPPVEKALEAMLRAAREAPGNPSSLHWAGRAARRIMEDAREQIAAYIGAEPGSIVFTSGGTEADNLAIVSLVSSFDSGNIVATAIEHPAVLRPLECLNTKYGPGWRVKFVHPDSDGIVHAEDMIAAMDENTRAVCMMLANNETGVIQPVAEVAASCHQKGIPIFVDAVQAMGKIPLNFGAMDVDMMALSAHKIGGPKGVGALVVRRGLKITELAPGGGQERKRRSGTENVPGIAGFASALGEIDFASMQGLRDDFESLLLDQLPHVRIYGNKVHRLPNTSMFSIPGIDGETLLMQLDLAGFAVASGSACSSGKREASHVLLAMGAAEVEARSSVRVSFAPGNTREDASSLVDELVRIEARLKHMAGMLHP